MANRKGPSYKDVAFAHVTSGMDAVRKMTDDNTLSRSVLENALANLVDAKQDVAEFAAFIVETHGAKGEKRGVTPPQNGDSRQYKAQQVKDGAVHARIPLNTLGLEKGELVDATFCAGVGDIPADIQPDESFILLRVSFETEEDEG